MLILRYSDHYTSLHTPVAPIVLSELRFVSHRPQKINKSACWWLVWLQKASTICTVWQPNVWEYKQNVLLAPKCSIHCKSGPAELIKNWTCLYFDILSSQIARASLPFYFWCKYWYVQYKGLLFLPKQTFIRGKRKMHLHFQHYFRKKQKRNQNRVLMCDYRNSSNKNR